METIMSLCPPAVRKLLGVESLRDQRGAGDPGLVGPILGLLNLFFLAYFERYLTEDRSRETLALLVFLQVALFIVLALTRFLSSTGEILRRGAIFPLTGWDRFVFTGISNLRRPVVLIWVGSVVLAFLILGHDSWVEIVVPTFLFLLLVVCSQVVVAVVLLAAARSNGSEGAIVWGVLAVTFGIVIAALLFGEMSFLRALLPVQWVADAMGAAREGDPQPSFRALAMLLGIGGGGLILARRVC